MIENTDGYLDRHVYARASTLSSCAYACEYTWKRVTASGIGKASSKLHKQLLGNDRPRYPAGYRGCPIGRVGSAIAGPPLLFPR